MLITILFCTLLILLFSGIRLNNACAENTFLNKSFTTNIRGIAILFIMVSHCILFLYYYKPLINNEILYYEKVIYWFIALFTNIGVGLFLFQSGYGNYFSLQKRTPKEWLTKKIIMLYTPVAVLLVVPYILSFFSKAYANIFPYWYSIFQKFFMMTLSHGVYWYIKVQLVAYILLFICCKLFRKNSYIILTLIFSIYVILALYFKIQSYWYMTVLCFPFGIICAKYSSEIKNFFRTHLIKKILILLLFTVLSCICAYLYNYEISMIFISLTASLLMVCFSLIVNLQSDFLKYLGEKSLILYLLHPEFIFIFRNFYVGKIGVVYCILFTLIVSIITAYPLYKFCNTDIYKIADK